MGIDYCAAIFVGLPRKELESLDSFQDWIDQDELNICPPYYDGNDASHAIVGFEVYSSQTYGASELKYDTEEVIAMQQAFKSLTGLDAKVYISTYGC